MTGVQTCALPISEEMRRLQAASGNGHAGVALAMSGSDAPRLRADLGELAPSLETSSLPDGDEAGWLGGLLQ